MKTAPPPPPFQKKKKKKKKRKKERRKEHHALSKVASKVRALSGTGTSHDHLDWPRQSYREQFKEGDEEADRGNDGKTTSKSGLALNGIYYCEKLRKARSGGSWLQNVQWCPNGQPDYGTDEIRSTNTYITPTTRPGREGMGTPDIRHRTLSPTERPRHFSTLGTMQTGRKKTVDTRHPLTQFGDWSGPSRPLSSACAQSIVV